MRKILTVLLVLLTIVAHAQQKGVGTKDNNVTAKVALFTDSLFVYRDTIIPVLDISYHEFSETSTGGWHKDYNLNDRYIRISNNVKNTWVVLDLQGLDQLWYEDGDIIRNGLTFGDTVRVDSLLIVNGNVEADYYFLGQDSLTHTNIYNGGDGVDGYVLIYSGDTAIWQPISLPGGGIITGRNLGVDGYGVFIDTLGSEMQFANVASADTFINVTMEDSTIYVGWDGTGRRILTAPGLFGGGDLGADRTISLYIPGLSEMIDTVDYAADWMIINDISTGIHYKIHPQDLLDVLGAYSDSIGIGLDGNVFYLKEPQTVSETSDNLADANGHSHRFSMNSFELIDLGDVEDTPVNGQYLKWDGLEWITDSPSGSGTNVDLYTNSTLRESAIDKINVVEQYGIDVTYGGDGMVSVKADTAQLATQYDVTQVGVYAENGLTYVDDTVILGGGLYDNYYTIIGRKDNDYDNAVYSFYNNTATGTAYGMGSSHPFYDQFHGMKTKMDLGTSIGVPGHSAYFDYELEVTDSTDNLAYDNEVKRIDTDGDDKITDAYWSHDLYYNDNGVGMGMSSSPYSTYLYFSKFIGSDGLSIYFPYLIPSGNNSVVMPITVNGVQADSTGNINIAEASSTTLIGDSASIEVDTTVIATQYDLSQATCNYAVQTLNSTSDTLDVANGVHGVLDISANTTIRIEPTATCNTGNITVICDAAGYTLTLTGGTMKFSPFVDSTAGVITTSAVAGGIDVFSYFFDGARIIINGTKNYE